MNVNVEVPRRVDESRGAELEAEMTLEHMNRKTFEACQEVQQALDAVRSAVSGNLESLLATLSGRMFRLISLVCRVHPPAVEDDQAAKRCLQLAEDCVEVARLTPYEELREDMDAFHDEVFEWNKKHSGKRPRVKKQG